MPEQCHAVLKTLGENFPSRCPAPAIPGEIYCPLHMVIEGRMKERARRHREMLIHIRDRGRFTQ